MNILLLCFAILVISVYSNDNTSKYRGSKIYQVTPSSIYEAEILKKFENDENYDFWTDIRFLASPVNIMISQSGQTKFEAVMKRENIDYAITVDDVEIYLEEKERHLVKKELMNGNVTFLDFMRHDEINSYLLQLAEDYPEITTVQSIGKSVEGRDLLLIKISSGGENKPTIFIEAAIHAREWIAPPVALYIINQLAENAENSYFYQDVDWVIIPVLNPDGYEFTHTHERFWRKTRSPGTICFGVDGNRNFDSLWGTVGASSWQCDNTYRGRRAFSEYETQAVRNYILAHKEQIKLFVDVHSFGRLLLHPYGYNLEEADNIEELQYLGALFNDAVHSVNGENYTVVSFASGLYNASGTSVDWVKEIGIDLAYTLELPSGGTGFDPPASDIESVVEETWEGFKAFHSYIQTKFIMK